MRASITRVAFATLMLRAAAGLNVTCPPHISVERNGTDSFQCRNSVVIPSDKIRLVKATPNSNPEDCQAQCTGPGNCAFAAVNATNNDCLMYGRSTLFGSKETITLDAGSEFIIINSNFTIPTPFDLTVNCPTEYLYNKGPSVAPLPYCNGSTTAPSGSALTSTDSTLTKCFTLCLANTKCAFATFPLIDPSSMGTCAMFGQAVLWDRTSSITLLSGSDVVIINPWLTIVSGNAVPSSTVSYNFRSASSSLSTTSATPFIIFWILAGLGLRILS